MYTTLLLYSLISSSLFYLGSRAMITKAIWSRYPPWFESFMSCPACAGFWYGLAIEATVGREYQLHYLGLDPVSWMTPIIVGLCSITTTPIVAGLMQWGLAWKPVDEVVIE